MPEATPTGPDDSLNRETLSLRAQQIVAGALYASTNQITIEKIRKTRDGYHSVTFKDLRSLATEGEAIRERTAVLDLAFPLEVRPINTLIEQHGDKEHRQLFLAIGAGVRDYPKKENQDPHESQRAFFATDLAYGIAPREENFQALGGLPQRYAIPSSMMRHEWPEATHFFNALDYRSIPDDSFDVIQIANVLTDPRLANVSYGEIMRVLKSGIGELVILNERGIQAHSIHHTTFMAEAYGGSVHEIVFNATHAEPEEAEMFEQGLSVVTKEKAKRLQKNYHIAQDHVAHGLDEGAYCVIIKKHQKP